MGQRRIAVTQEIIDNSTRNQSRHCMVADAMKAAIPDASRIIVDLNTIRLTMKNGHRWAYITPNKVGNYIVAFDAGETIEPFTFVLNDQMRVAIRRSVATPAGKVKDTAEKAQRDAIKRLAKVENDPDATPAQVEVAKEKVAAAAQRLDEATAKLAESGGPATRNEKDTLPPDPDTGLSQMRGPRRLTYKADRQFGRRVLRENQETVQE